MNLRQGLGAAVAALAALPGCSLTSDHFSCSMYTSGARVRCVDYQDVGIQFRATAGDLSSADSR